jgi:parallel beta-helix repeat protein
MSGASWSKMDSCSMPENRDGGHSQFWPMSYYGAQFNKGADGSYGTCQRDTFTNNTFVLTTADTFWYGVDRPTTDPNGAYWMIRVDALDNALFKNNKITVKYLAKTLYRTAARAAYFSQSERDSFIDNKWTFTDSTTLSDRDSQDFSNSWRIREKWRFMKYLRDTLIVNGVTGADNAAVLFASSGGEGPAYTSGMHQRNRWHQCYFRWEHNSGTDDDYGLFGFESAPSVYPTAASGLYNDTLSYCIIATNTASKNGNGGIWFADVMGANLIDHCTFFGTSSAASLLEQINWGNKGRWGTGATLRITNNIFYAPATTGSSTGMTINQFQSAANRTSLYSDNNLFAVYRGTGKDIKFKTNCTQYGGGCTATLESGVPSGQWFTQTGNDGLSVHGSPKFTDSTFATFDPTPGAGSAAINLGENGTTAGAIQVLVDATAPAAIADLHALSMSSSGTEIRWTAPGDSVNTGTAQAYYIKYATTAITNDATYNSAALGAVLACQVAGSTETFVLNLPSHSTTYWIAIKTVDEAGNYSALSNIISVRTASQDPNDVSTEWL